MSTTYSLSRTVGPTAEALTLAQVKTHLELISSDTIHDSKLNLWIQAAREKIESESEYVLITQTYTLSFSEFPDQRGYNSSYWYGATTSRTWDDVEEILLPRRPVQSVSSVTYYDSDNSQQTLATTVYGLDAPRRLIYLKYDQQWPSVTVQHNGCVITFVAGYGAAVNVPSVLKQLMLLQIASWWCDRGDLPQDEYSMAYDRLRANVAERTSYP